MEESRSLLGLGQSPRRRWIPFAVSGIGLLLIIVGVATLYQRVFEVAEDSIAQQRSIDGDYGASSSATRDHMAECDEFFLEQRLDHFDLGGPSYLERFFVCDREYRRDDGVMFFYAGNEADVELYLNHTGLMWDNAREFGAMLVFAEHRYFGRSIPFRDEVRSHIKYLSTEQALADYAVLITHIKSKYKRDIPVMGFGGSYGGMLAAWLRMKYPHIMDGAIAGSAPILSFLHQDPPVDMGSYARIVARDASPETGTAPLCANNIRRAWQAMLSRRDTVEGRQKLKSALRVCEHTPFDSEDDVAAFMMWAKESFDTLAMGNYPYPSSYVMNGRSVLPPYPMRAACAHVQGEFEDDLALLDAFAQSIGVYYNSSKDQACYDFSAPPDEISQFDDLWEYIICAETYQPQSADGVQDMYWSMPWNYSADDEQCRRKWGVGIRPRWGVTQYGGHKALRFASNIIFSNGDLDPWSGTRVLESASDSVIALKVEGGAHQLDLMFSTPLDPPGVIAAREVEKEHMRRWIRQFYEHKESIKAKLHT